MGHNENTAQRVNLHVPQAVSNAIVDATNNDKLAWTCPQHSRELVHLQFGETQDKHIVFQQKSFVSSICAVAKKPVT
jgi:hypothetical protein